MKDSPLPLLRCPFCFAVGFSKDHTLADHIYENHEPMEIVDELAERIAEQRENPYPPSPNTIQAKDYIESNWIPISKIHGRIKELKSKPEIPSTTNAHSPYSEWSGRIKELKNLLPESKEDKK